MLERCHAGMPSVHQLKLFPQALFPQPVYSILRCNRHPVSVRAGQNDHSGGSHNKHSRLAVMDHAPSHRNSSVWAVGDIELETNLHYTQPGPGVYINLGDKWGIYERVGLKRWLAPGRVACTITHPNHSDTSLNAIQHSRLS